MCSMSEASFSGAGSEGCTLLAEGFGFVAKGAEASVEVGHRSAQSVGLFREACALSYGVGANL